MKQTLSFIICLLLVSSAFVMAMSGCKGDSQANPDATNSAIAPSPTPTADYSAFRETSPIIGTYRTKSVSQKTGHESITNMHFGLDGNVTSTALDGTDAFAGGFDSVTWYYNMFNDTMVITYDTFLGEEVVVEYAVEKQAENVFVLTTEGTSIMDPTTMTLVRIGD